MLFIYSITSIFKPIIKRSVTIFIQSFWFNIKTISRPLAPWLYLFFLRGLEVELNNSRYKLVFFKMFYFIIANGMIIYIFLRLPGYINKINKKVYSVYLHLYQISMYVWSLDKMKKSGTIFSRTNWVDAISGIDIA